MQLEMTTRSSVSVPLLLMPPPLWTLPSVIVKSEMPTILPLWVLKIRDMSATLNIPDLIKEGSVAYGMQSFDQSLMQHYSRSVVSYESAVFYATSPSEFALRVQGVAGTSDTSWAGFEEGPNG